MDKLGKRRMELYFSGLSLDHWLSWWSNRREAEQAERPLFCVSLSHHNELHSNMPQGLYCTVVCTSIKADVLFFSKHFREFLS